MSILVCNTRKVFEILHVYIRISCARISSNRNLVLLGTMNLRNITVKGKTDVGANICREILMDTKTRRMLNTGKYTFTKVLQRNEHEV